MALGHGIERRRRLVEDEHRRVHEQRARQRDPLALAGRQRRSALAHQRRVAVGQARHELVDAGRPRRRAHLVVRRLGPRVADVVGDRGVKHERFLIDEDDVTAEIVEREILDVVAVEPDGARVRVEQAQQQVGDRRFAAAARADQREALARRDRERHAVQHLTPAEIDRDIVERDRAADGAQPDGRRPLDDVGRQIEQLVDAVERHLHGGQARVESHQRLHRLQQPHLIGHEGDERAERQRSADDTAAAVDEHRAVAERQQQPRHAAGQIGPQLHRHQRVDERDVAAAERVHFARLRIGGDDETDGLHGFDQETANRAARFADRLDPCRELDAHARQRPHARRHHGQRDQRQFRIEREHGDHAAGQEQDVADPREQ